MVSVTKDEEATPVLEYDEPLLIFPLGDWVDEESDIPGGGTRQGYGYKREWLESSVRKQHYQKSVSLLARGGN